MRKTKTIVVTAEGRDKSKTYFIREMSAAKAEAWATRAMEAVAKSGAMIPETILNAGMSGLYGIGLRSFLGAPFELTKPLLDEMFLSCVSIVPDPAKPHIMRGAGGDGIDPIGPMIDDDTEEVATRLMLRSEVFELHTGFSVADFLSQAWESAKAALEASSQVTPTSEEP